MSHIYLTRQILLEVCVDQCAFAFVNWYSKSAVFFNIESVFSCLCYFYHVYQLAYFVGAILSYYRTIDCGMNARCLLYFYGIVIR